MTPNQRDRTVKPTQRGAVRAGLIVAAALGLLLVVLFKTLATGSAGGVEAVLQQSRETVGAAASEVLPTSADDEAPPLLMASAETDSRVAVATQEDRAGTFEAEVRLRSSETGRAVAGRVLLVAQDDDQRWIEAPGGRWRGALPDGTYTIAAVEGPDSVPEFQCEAGLSGANPRIEVLVTEFAPWRLSVLDSETGEHVENLTLFVPSDDDESTARFAEAGPQAVPQDGVLPLLEGVRSPLRIEDSPDQGIYWISAPGYLSQALRRNRFQRQGSVELERAGNLSIRIAVPFAKEAMSLAHKLNPGDWLETSIALAVAPVDDPEHIAFETVAQAKVHEVQLAQGRYAVTVSTDGRQLSPVVLFREEVNVTAGAQQYLDVNTVAVVPVPDVQTTTLTLTAILPEKLGLDGDWVAQVMVQPLGSERWEPLLMENVEEWTHVESINAFSRTFDATPLGQYRFRVMPSGQSIEFQLDVVDEHGTEILLNGSDVALLNLELPEVPEGAEPLVARLSYVEGGDVVGGLRAQLDPNTRSTQVWCEPRPLQVQVVGSDSASEIVDVYPVAGASITVPLALSDSNLALVLLTAWSQRSHALVERGYWSTVTVEGVGHPGSLVEKRYGQNGTSVPYGTSLVAPDWSRTVLVLSAPGRYRITLPGHPNPLELDAPSGLSEHSIFLE